MGEGRNGLVILVGLTISFVFIYFIMKELNKPKTIIEEVVRDESGRIIQVVRRETY